MKAKVVFEQKLDRVEHRRLYLRGAASPPDPLSRDSLGAEPLHHVTPIADEMMLHRRIYLWGRGAAPFPPDPLSRGFLEARSLGTRPLETRYLDR